MFIYNILTKWSVRGLTLPGVFSLVFVYPYLVARQIPACLEFLCNEISKIFSVIFELVL